MIRRPGVGLARRGDLRGTGAGGGLSLLTLPTTDLLLHLDARTGVTEGATFTWADQSGNGNDATQSTGANQPSVETNGTLGTVVRFDDANTEHLLASGPALSGGEYTIIAVVDTTDTGDQDALIAWDSNTPLVNLRRFASTFMGIFDGATYRANVVGADGVQVIRVTISDAADTVTIHRDGTQIVSDSWPNTTTSAGSSVVIGNNSAITAGGAFEGDIAFLGVWGNSNTAQAEAAEAYLAQEWPLP